MRRNTEKKKIEEEERNSKRRQDARPREQSLRCEGEVDGEMVNRMKEDAALYTGEDDSASSSHKLWSLDRGLALRQALDVLMIDREQNWQPV